MYLGDDMKSSFSELVQKSIAMAFLDLWEDTI